MEHKSSSPGFWQRAAAWLKAHWDYCYEGVWEDRRDIFKVKAVKTVNLTVRTFLSTDLQSKACAMTYRTLLAIVPALALLFAIGRGFGFQNIIQNQLFNYLPSQHRALEMAFQFVDSCLAQASEGLFVGVGIVFLLWTIISLLDSVEETFNEVWGVVADRSFFRKVTDYLAICIILPILMICSGGLQVFMSNTIQRLLPFDFLSPVVSVVFDLVSYILAWLFFAGAYVLIPNTKVSIRNALMAGVIAGTGFQILQWLFVSGQLYVAKYNAIYGTFSFLPLMLIWMQLSWLITLAGALVCCSAQNISHFLNLKQTSSISPDYRRKVSVAVMAVIAGRFKRGEKPVSISSLSADYLIPSKLASQIVTRLVDCGLAVYVTTPGHDSEAIDLLPVQPSMSLDHYTLGSVNQVLDTHGSDDFIPGFDRRFGELSKLCDRLDDSRWTNSSLLSDITVNNTDTLKTT